MSKRAFLTFLFLWIMTVIRAQNAMDNFGQNRIQFKDFDWQYYNSEHFTTYFYAGGQELGRFVVTTAEKDLLNIDSVLGYLPDNRVNILVYNSLEDLYQTNIGAHSGLFDNNASNTGGVVRVEADKMFIYFNGDHKQLRAQIRAGITKIIIQQMLFNGNVQEAVQNNTLSVLPAWFSEGLYSYLGSAWSVNEDDQLRIKLGNSKLGFDKLAKENPTLIGKSFWDYVLQKYGKDAISSLIYMTRINRSVETGIAYALNKNYDEVAADWLDFYTKHYANENFTHRAVLEENMYILKNKHKELIYGTALSPDGNLAFVMNRMGRSRVIIYDKEKHKTKTRFRTGFTSYYFKPDNQSPIVSWNSSGDKLAITEERRGKQYLWLYDFSNKKTKVTKGLISNFQKITSMCFSPFDPNMIAMTAINKGQSDVYTYNVGSGSVQQITNDKWDDADAHFVRLKNRTGLVFSSNRPGDTLKNKWPDSVQALGNYDIFFYNTKTKLKKLVRITQTPVFDERQPEQFNNRYFSFLSDENGIINRKLGWIDSTIDRYNIFYYFKDSVCKNPAYNFDSLWLAQGIKPDSVVKKPVYKDIGHTVCLTDYNTNIIEHATMPKTGMLVQHLIGPKGDFFEWVKVPKDSVQTEPTMAPHTLLGKFKKHKEERFEDSLNSILTVAKTSKKLLIDSFMPKTLNPVYQSPYFNPVIVRKQDSVKFFTKKTVQSAAVHKEPLFKVNKILPYYPRFYTDRLSAQLDNTVLFSQYQKFDNLSTGGQTYDNLPLSGMIGAAATDMMEDYRVQAGFSFPLNLSANFQFYAAFMNYKKRLDKTLIYYRNTELVPYVEQSTGKNLYVRLKTNVLQYQLNYPLDYTQRISGILGYRQDKNVFQSTDPISSPILPSRSDWGLMRLEYCYDNTLPLGLNIMKGTRMKFFFEHHRSIDTINHGFFAYGGDIRHYIVVDKNIIFATRLSGASSFGSGQVLYYLGGTSNWLTPHSENGTTISSTANYIYQALSTPLRGFGQDVRNGNSYALLNAELRVPIISYFSKNVIKNQFFKNLMVIGFFDVGSAWQGWSPYSSDNPYNTGYKSQAPVYVTIQYYRQPVVAGFGYGIRSTVLGYYIRLDVGWGVNNGEVTPGSTTYLSIGTDF